MTSTQPLTGQFSGSVITALLFILLWVLAPYAESYALRLFMGVEYKLINMTKRECISFMHMDGAKMKELAGNPAQASLVTWYLLNNQGDNIQFISDTYNEWPFNIGERGDELSFKDVTIKYIDILIEQKILKNDGVLYVDEDEPHNIYIFNLKNIWLE